MVKGQEGLGIQITGGRGSKRSPHGIIIAHVEEGGAIHRYSPNNVWEKASAADIP